LGPLVVCKGPRAVAGQAHLPARRAAGRAGRGSGGRCRRAGPEPKAQGCAAWRRLPVEGAGPEHPGA